MQKNFSDSSQDIVPIIDLKEDSSILSKKLFSICKNTGFFYVTNHGIKEEFLERVFEESKKFFTLKEEQKRSCFLNKYNRGWGPMQEETSDVVNQKTGDLKEGYYIGREPANDEIFPLCGPNVWPSENLLPGWKEIMADYHNQLQHLGLEIVRNIALSLELQRGKYSK